MERPGLRLLTITAEKRLSIRSEMLRRLLNIASIVCLVACVALMGMWVRSYWLDDG